MTAYTISELTDKRQIHTYLMTDINYAAYAMGDLEPPYSEYATWVAASRTGTIDGLALIYHGLEPPVLFLMGDKPAISALFIHGVGPEEVYYNAPPDFRDILNDFYDLDDTHHMYRMRVTSGIFKPLDDYDKHPSRPQILDRKHTQAIMSLMHEAATVDDRDWRDVALNPEMIPGGYFHGIHRDDRLIAVAGTHVVARQAKMAAVGNVVVHPGERCKGLGSLVSHAVTKALLDDGFKLVVLNVQQTNSPAIKIYKRLGYQQVSKFIEGAARRR